MHTTNYHNTFIEIAEDCPLQASELPPQKGEAKTIANIQFEMIAEVKKVKAMRSKRV
jgi:hypothetical protein